MPVTPGCWVSGPTLNEAFRRRSAYYISIAKVELGNEVLSSNYSSKSGLPSYHPHSAEKLARMGFISCRISAAAAGLEHSGLFGSSLSCVKCHGLSIFGEPRSTSFSAFL